MKEMIGWLKTMIKVENIDIFGWEAAIRGMRNPMNSWERSDSEFGCEVVTGSYKFCNECSYRSDWCKNPQEYIIGPSDHELMMKLAKGGPVHAKYRRMIHVQMDITAPLYWWKEFDTYKVGTVANSCSTMHKIHEKQFALGDFSHDRLLSLSVVDDLSRTVASLNTWRNIYLNWDLYKDRDELKSYTKKDIWYQMIQLLPSSYNQKRTVDLSYETLYSIYKWRKNHKLDEWVDFCKELEKLPYSEIFTLEWDYVKEN